MFSSIFDVIGFGSSAMKTKKNGIVGCEYMHIMLVLIRFSEMQGGPWDPGVNQGRPWAV